MKQTIITTLTDQPLAEHISVNDHRHNAATALAIGWAVLTIEACRECQAGRCCGKCWCCYDRDRR